MVQTVVKLICIPLCILQLLFSACPLKAHSIQLDSSNSDTTINTGDSLTLICLTNAVPSWTYPLKNRNPESFSWNTKVVTETHAINGPYKFNSTLTIIDAYFAHTGYYVCNSSPMQSETVNSPAIYIYIAHQQHLAAPSFVFTIYANLNEAFTIPCRPTNPNIAVTLFNDRNEEMTNKKFITYNPRVGFIVKNPIMNLFGFWPCYFKYNGTTETSGHYIFSGNTGWPYA